jgi:hypothetical protein
MDKVQIAQDAISGTLATLIGALLLSAGAPLAWPFRWWVQGRSIRHLIANERRFNFVFNPASGIAKEITILANGTVGQGRNQNEYMWRIRRGALEILASDGKVYSRFRHDRTHGTLKRTNDPELRSIPGQYMQARLVKIARGAA